MKGFQSSFSFFASFAIGKISHLSSIRVNKEPLLLNCMCFSLGIQLCTGFAGELIKAHLTLICCWWLIFPYKTIHKKHGK